MHPHTPTPSTLKKGAPQKPTPPSSPKPAQLGVRRVSVLEAQQQQAFKTCAENTHFRFLNSLGFARAIQTISPNSKYLSLTTKTQLEWQVTCHRYILHHRTILVSPIGKGEENRKDRHLPHFALPHFQRSHSSHQAHHTQHHNFIQPIKTLMYSQKVYMYLAMC